MKSFKIINLFIILSLFVFSGCKKIDLQNDADSCIENVVKKMQDEHVTNPPGSIFQYKYKDKTVYFIPAHCCDITSEVLDNSCNTICRPDGGFTGHGDGKCPDFFSSRTNEKLIWKDNRK